MQMTTDARTTLDAIVRRILARHALGDAERAGITYELMSHLHSAGEARAQAADRAEVGREDIEAALAEAGGDEGLAAAFVEPLAKPVERVLFWRRLGAFAIDALLLLAAIGLVHTGITFLSGPYLLVDDSAPAHGDEDAWGLMPWGYHDATLPVAVQALIALASAAVVLGYFTWFEGHEGRSLGKRATGLRVMRADGKPMSYRAALLRNIAKLMPLLLIVDTLLMLLLFRKDRQRVSDKVAETIVVRS